jgi:hypothetical protein
MPTVETIERGKSDKGTYFDSSKIDSSIEYHLFCQKPSSAGILGGPSAQQRDAARLRHNRNRGYEIDNHHHICGDGHEI